MPCGPVLEFGGPLTLNCVGEGACSKLGKLGKGQQLPIEVKGQEATGSLGLSHMRRALTT